MTASPPKPRFSGHETFACRFVWMPRAVRLIGRDPGALADDQLAIMELGLGKNMVRSLRFWLEAFEVAVPERGEWRLLPFGAAMLGPEGLDPFIERVETQWLLHWRLATTLNAPLFVWRHLFFRRMRPDFTRSELLLELRAEGARIGHELSDVTLLQHVDALLHTYLGSASPGAPEDALDGPLVDLGLIRRHGRRRAEMERIEPLFSLSRVPIGEVGEKVVDYAISDFWQSRRQGNGMVTFRDLAHAEGSPGAALRLDDDDLREHLERSTSLWGFRASGDAGNVVPASPVDPAARLREVYA